MGVYGRVPLEVYGSTYGEIFASLSAVALQTSQCDTGTLAAVDRGLKFEKLDDGFGRVISLEKI